jgi:hypothetical protein
MIGTDTHTLSLVFSCASLGGKVAKNTLLSSNVMHYYMHTSIEHVQLEKLQLNGAAANTC